MPSFSSSVYTGRRPRLLIADDHVLIAEAIRNLLEPQFEVVGVVPDGGQLVTSIDALRPDVVILDISMPLMNGFDAGERIKEKKRDIKLIYLTMSRSEEMAAEAFRRGASGYVLKTDAVAGLGTAIHSALRGKSYISPGINKDECERLIRIGKRFSGSKSLTHRQREILQLLARGMTLKEMAHALNIKPGTVAFHKYRIMEVLGIKTSAALCHYALTQLESDGSTVIAQPVPEARPEKTTADTSLH